jgi:hypothetical protein
MQQIITIATLIMSNSYQLAYSKVDRLTLDKCWEKVQPNKEIRDLVSPQGKAFLENMIISNNITEIYKQPIWIDVGCVNGVPYNVHPMHEG